MDPILGMAVAGAGQQAASGLLGMALEKRADKRQIRQQKELTKIQEEANRRQAAYSHELAMDMWNKTNVGAQMKHIKEAGLNPALMYGTSGGGGTTAGAGVAGSVSGGAAPTGGGEMQGLMQQGMGLNIAMMKAQLDNLKANTEKTRAEAAKTAGVDTENVKADTANKILEGVVKDYMGREAAAQFKIKEDNRSIEAKTYQDELEARQGLAGVIYDLWTEGKLHEKSYNEIEAQALQNANTREQKRKIIKEIDLLERNIKEKDLSNAILELEKELQETTGIDRNSPFWFKMLGRLFVQFFN